MATHICCPIVICCRFGRSALAFQDQPEKNTAEPNRCCGVVLDCLAEYLFNFSLSLSTSLSLLSSVSSSLSWLFEQTAVDGSNSSRHRRGGEEATHLFIWAVDLIFFRFHQRVHSLIRAIDAMSLRTESPSTSRTIG
jgi:hypothetical protein